MKRTARMKHRYEAAEIDGKWFVIDLRLPDKGPVLEERSERDARVTADISNILEGYARCYQDHKHGDE